MTTFEKIIATNPPRRNHNATRNTRNASEILKERRFRAYYILDKLAYKLVKTSQEIEKLVEEEETDVIELKLLEIEEIHEKMDKCVAIIQTIDNQLQVTIYRVATKLVATHI